MAYGRFRTDIKRQVVIVASTNLEEDLPVVSGGSGRRWLPIKVSWKDGLTSGEQYARVTDYFKRNRDWLWYVMMQRWAEGDYTLNPPVSVTDVSSELVSQHKQQNTILREDIERTLTLLDGQEYFQILWLVENMERKYRASAIAAELKNLGWQQRQCQKIIDRKKYTARVWMQDAEYYDAHKAEEDERILSEIDESYRHKRPKSPRPIQPGTTDNVL